MTVPTDEEVVGQTVYPAISKSKSKLLIVPEAVVPVTEFHIAEVVVPIFAPLPMISGE